MEARPAALSLVRSRIAVAALFCAAGFSVIAARLAEVMIFTVSGSVDVNVSETARPMRADLVDRNGVLIARDLPVSDLYASPATFWDPSEAAHSLALATGADETHLREAFAPKRGYVLVQRALTPDAR